MWPQLVRLYRAYTVGQDVATVVDLLQPLPPEKSVSERQAEIPIDLIEITRVFGEALPALEQWAKAAALVMGKSPIQVMREAANVGRTLSPLELTGEEAVKESTKVLEIADVVALQLGGSVPRELIAQAIAEAMLGDREALAPFGLQFDEATFQEAMVAGGYDELTGQARRLAEALVTLQLVTDKSADAHLDYAENVLATNRIEKSNLQSRADLGALRNLSNTATDPVLEELYSLWYGKFVDNPVEYIPRQDSEAMNIRARQSYDQANFGRAADAFEYVNENIGPTTVMELVQALELSLGRGFGGLLSELTSEDVQSLLVSGKDQDALKLLFTEYLKLAVMEGEYALENALSTPEIEGWQGIADEFAEELQQLQEALASENDEEKKTSLFGEITDLEAMLTAVQGRIDALEAARETTTSSIGILTDLADGIANGSLRLAEGIDRLDSLAGQGPGLPEALARASAAQSGSPTSTSQTQAPQPTQSETPQRLESPTQTLPEPASSETVKCIPCEPASVSSRPVSPQDSVEAPLPKLKPLTTQTPVPGTLQTDVPISDILKELRQAAEIVPAEAPLPKLKPPTTQTPVPGTFQIDVPIPDILTETRREATEAEIAVLEAKRRQLLANAEANRDLTLSSLEQRSAEGLSAEATEKSRAALEQRLSAMEVLAAELDEGSEDWIALSEAIALARSELQLFNDEAARPIPMPNATVAVTLPGMPPTAPPDTSAPKSFAPPPQDAGGVEELTDPLAAELESLMMNAGRTLVDGVIDGNLEGALRSILGSATDFFVGKMLNGILGPIAESISKNIAGQLLGDGVEAVSGFGKVASGVGIAGSAAGGLGGLLAGLNPTMLLLGGGFMLLSSLLSRRDSANQNDLTNQPRGASAAPSINYNLTAAVTVDASLGFEDPAFYQRWRSETENLVVSLLGRVREAPQ